MHLPISYLRVQSNITNYEIDCASKLIECPRTAKSLPRDEHRRATTAAAISPGVGPSVRLRRRDSTVLRANRPVRPPLSHSNDRTGSRVHDLFEWDTRSGMLRARRRLRPQHCRARHSRFETSRPDRDARARPLLESRATVKGAPHEPGHSFFARQHPPR